MRDGVANAIRDRDGGPIHAGRTGAFEAFFPNRLAGFQIDAFGDTRIFVNINMAFANRAGTDALFGFGMIPDAPRFGHVAGAIDFDGEIFPVEAAHRDRDSIGIKRRGVGERIKPATGPDFSARFWI